MALAKSSVWESGHEVVLFVLNLVRYSMRTNYNKNIQGGREFHALSEYSIILLKICSYSKDIPKIKWLTFAFRGYIYKHLYN